MPVPSEVVGAFKKPPEGNGEQEQATKRPGASSKDGRAGTSKHQCIHDQYVAQPQGKEGILPQGIDIKPRCRPSYQDKTQSQDALYGKRV